MTFWLWFHDLIPEDLDKMIKLNDETLFIANCAPCVYSETVWVWYEL